MATTALTRSSPAMSVIDGIVYTLSTAIAAYFGKQHRNVLQAIEALIAQLPPDRLLNFQQTLIERPNPAGGEPIKSPAYRLTRDGFTLLAMGFTGKRALGFKLAYLDAFNAMEAELLAKQRPLPLSESGTVVPGRTLAGTQWLAQFATDGSMTLKPLAEQHELEQRGAKLLAASNREADARHLALKDSSRALHDCFSAAAMVGKMIMEDFIATGDTRGQNRRWYVSIGDTTGYVVRRLEPDAVCVRPADLVNMLSRMGDSAAPAGKKP